MPTPEPAEVFSRGSYAPPARTLVDVLAKTVEQHNDATAIDDGNAALTYGQLSGAVRRTADMLAARGVAAGDRVGIRIPSGTVELYVAILSTLSVGAAYVPVDHDDPDERARLVFNEADVAVVLGADAEIQQRRPDGSVRSKDRASSPGGARSKSSERTAARAPEPGDDARVTRVRVTHPHPLGVTTPHPAAADRRPR